MTELGPLSLWRMSERLLPLGFRSDGRNGGREGCEKTSHSLCRPSQAKLLDAFGPQGRSEPGRIGQMHLCARQCLLRLRPLPVGDSGLLMSLTSLNTGGYGFGSSVVPSLMRSCG